MYTKRALKKCGYPKWCFKKKDKKKKQNNNEHYPIVTIPYVNKISEKIAKTFKEHKIKAVHKPSSTIKNILFNNKDRIHHLDKSEIIYEVECKKHKELYIGETGGPMKDRGYEHRIVEHKNTKISHSIKRSNSETDQNNNEINTSTRQSSRLSKKTNINYKKMNEGKKIIINPGTSKVAKHMQNEEREKEDIDYRIIGNETNWYKRGIKEAIEIRRKRPTLNADDGRYHLWTKTIQRQSEKTLQCTLQNDPQTVNNEHLLMTT